MAQIKVTTDAVHAHASRLHGVGQDLLGGVGSAHSAIVDGAAATGHPQAHAAAASLWEKANGSLATLAQTTCDVGTRLHLAADAYTAAENGSAKLLKERQ